MSAAVPSAEIGTLSTESSVRHLVVFQKTVPRDVAAQVRAAGGELVRVLPEIGLAIAVSADPRLAAAMNRVRGVTAVGPAHVAGTVAAAFGGGRVVGVGPNLGAANASS